MSHSPPIAIVGVGGVFPGARDSRAFWELLRDGRSAARPAPPGRWTLDPSRCQGTAHGQVDRVVSSRACLLDAVPLETAGLDLDGLDVAALDPTVALALSAARRAWDQAVVAPLDPRRVGVVLGHIALPTEGASLLADWILGRRFERQLFDAAGVVAPAETRRAPPPLAHRATGLVAGVVARALGLGGLQRTLDAACASTWFALHHAAVELAEGRLDAVLAGGLSRPDPLYTQMGFSQLRALSPSGTCRPFDCRGDGLVVGEGGGVFVLKRLDDALAHDDRVLGVIRGIGLSNDVDGRLLAPSEEGQLRALRAAYRAAGWSPTDVDLIECHATGTPVGDGVELASLAALFEGLDTGERSVALGAVKANVGHLLTGAGAPALAKLLASFEHGEIPPVAGFDEPLPGVAAPLVAHRQAVPWERRAPDVPRRAGLSGFGFGGTNAHVLVEEFLPRARRDAVAPGLDLPAGGVPSGAPAPTAGAANRSASPTGADPSPTPIALVAAGARWGPWEDAPALARRLLGGDEGRQPTTKRHAGGLDEPPRGFLIDELSLPLGRYRIPPVELEAALPQQLVLLEAAAEARETRVGRPADPLRTGVFIGLGLDLGTTDYHLRWSLRERAPRWAAALGLDLTDDQLQAWTDDLADQLGPALDANRVMGHLGGIVASRVSREFGLGGPCTVVGTEESSGLSALAAAVGALRRGELDEALVGAVDLGADVRAWLADDALRPHARGETRPFDRDADGALVGEGALAFVLRRADDAIRDGEQVLAEIVGLGEASGGRPGDGAPDDETLARALEAALADAGLAPAALGQVACHGSAVPNEDGPEARALRRVLGQAPPSLTSAAARAGAGGAASGLLSLWAATASLRDGVLPPLSGHRRPRSGVEDFGRPATPRPRLPGPGDHALVTSLSSTGHGGQLLLRRPTQAAAPAVARPLGPLAEALFVVEADDEDGLSEGLAALAALAQASPATDVEALARHWLAERPRRPDAARAVALLARDWNECERLARLALDQDLDPAALLRLGGGRVVTSAAPLGPRGGVAFLFPGSGSHHPDMGRELALSWPDVLAERAASNPRLAEQLRPDLAWDGSAEQQDGDARGLILAQIAQGTLAADVLARHGVRPSAVVGYSLGETAGLFALGAWRDRELMLDRVLESELFTDELTGACRAARRAWGLAEGEAVDWALGVVDRPAPAVRRALEDLPRAYLLIVNTPDECVVGGDRSQVLELVERLGARWHEVRGVTTVHCAVAREVERAYRDLHLLPTTPPDDVRFYSGAAGASYEVTRESAADAILAQALDGIDYPATVTRAWEDGARIFVELGPGGSCARMVDRILEGRDHVAVSVDGAGRPGVAGLLGALAVLIAERVPVDLSPLYGEGERPVESERPRCLTVPVGRRAVDARLPAPPVAEPVPPAAPPVLEPAAFRDDAGGAGRPTGPARPPQQAAPAAAAAPALAAGAGAGIHEPLLAAHQATLAAHDAWLSFARTVGDQLLAGLEGDPLAEAAQLAAGGALQAATAAPPASAPPVDPTASAEQAPPPVDPTASAGHAAPPVGPAASAATLAGAPPIEQAPPSSARVVLDRDQCLTFAVGRVGDVLGPFFAPADDFPTRVRLPDEPLMLVDRITALEGEPGSMTSGRVVTEHDVLHDGWYLDGGRIPTCIAVEAGQADLFLSGWLGIDLQTRGRAVYRLLDAVVTFHDELPRPGQVIRYDIRIEHFFRQGDTWLFRFAFDGTVDGRPLLTMRDGCAGFFTQAELDAGQGIVARPLDSGPDPRSLPADWTPLAPLAPCALDEAGVAALRAGDLAAAFGPAFAGLPVEQPLTLPGGKLSLVHRVLAVEPSGGRFGLGFVRAEADVHPDDWFLTCHFVDDMVMPGTLMYECCLHTLRVFLLRMGWVVDGRAVTTSPVPGVKSRLRCRGQVLDTTRVVTYEVSVKELGYGPEPYAIVDALMLADGKPIVEIGDMSLRLVGATRETVERVWRGRSDGAAGGALPVDGPHAAAPHATAAQAAPPQDATQHAAPQRDAAAHAGPDALPPVYTYEQVLAFSDGEPSAAFGAPYRPFDSDGPRAIARLPRPPFQFLDRITAVTGEPFEMKAGATAEAQWVLRADDWTRAASRQDAVPFAQLLEATLQPCGWLSAYVGSALTSEADLCYRNLGGDATLHRQLPFADDLLTVRTELTSCSSAGGMILQDFRFETWSRALGLVYEGSTSFGFFSREALAAQVGLSDPAAWNPGDDGRPGSAFVLPREAPFPDETWRMVERVESWLPDGGPAGLGSIHGSIDVDPTAWFFGAHFKGDPVWPGSLGLEACLQLLLVAAHERFGAGRAVGPPAGSRHRWTYRGQVVPSAGRVEVSAWITAVDEARRVVVGSGRLSVDGRPIYAMEDFAVELAR